MRGAGRKGRDLSAAARLPQAPALPGTGTHGLGDAQGGLATLGGPKLAKGTLRSSLHDALHTVGAPETLNVAEGMN